MYGVGRALALLLLVGGCAAGRGPLPRPAPHTLPAASPLRSETLSDGDAWLRHHLVGSDFAGALGVLRKHPDTSGDRLLDGLQRAIILHRSGEHSASNELLEWVEIEADRRYTRSLSREAAAFAVNDRVLAYTPSPVELTMIPLYRMLNYLAIGELDGALVESRKANALLARLERDPVQRCRADGMLLYVSGLVQSAAGERNDALVSLRQAEQAYGACGDRGGTPDGFGPDLHRAARAVGLSEVADSVAERYGLDPREPEAAGDLVILVEQGFVSHLGAEALHVPIYPQDLEGTEGGGADRLALAAARVSARLLENFAQRSVWGAAADDLPWVQWAHAAEGAHVMRLAWPVTRREPLVPAEVRVLVGDSMAQAASVSTVSELVERQLESERPVLTARLVARGLVKLLISREIEDQAERRAGELAAFFAGRLSNLAANELERPDTRSWSLLPDRIALVRLRLPPGTHRIRVETATRDGSAVEIHNLGDVEIAPGRLRAVSTWVVDGAAGGQKEIAPSP